MIQQNTQHQPQPPASVGVPGSQIERDLYILTTANASIEIGRPPAEIFAHLADFSRLAEWMPPCSNVESTGPAASGVGATFRLEEEHDTDWDRIAEERAEVGSAIEAVAEIIITALEPDARIGWTTTIVDGDPLLGGQRDSALRLTPISEYITRVELDCQLVAPESDLIDLVQHLQKRGYPLDILQRRMDRALHNLRGLIEPTPGDARTPPMHRHVRARVLQPDVAVTTADEVQATYTPEQAMAEARRALEAGFDLEAAKGGCPFKVDIPRYFRKIAEGDFDSALAIIRESHPFPSIFGRMCHAFCQQATPPLQDIGRPWKAWTPPVRKVDPVYGSESGWNLSRGHPSPSGAALLNDESAIGKEAFAQPALSWSAVAGTIRGVGHGSGIPGGGGIERPAYLLLERFAGDYGNPYFLPLVPERPPSGKHIAVIGAGSGGLANAWMLRRLGHDVDIYDALSVPGGTLYAGYPPHRMTKFAVRREDDPTSWGARFFGGRRFSAGDIEQLAREYDLVFLSTGMFEPRMAGIPGEDADGVWHAMYFIAEVSYGRQPGNGGTCVIIGAGHTAEDAAQTARRLGSPIKVFYRRGLDEMPIDAADPTEHVSRLADDGIEYHFLALPLRILADDENRVTGVEFARVRLGEPDSSGRRAPHPIPGSNFVEPCGLVIEAVGESVELSTIPRSIATRDGFVYVNRRDHRTTHPKIFAGGDVIGDKGNDGAALAGIEAAQTMDSLLRGERLVLFDTQPLR